MDPKTFNLDTTALENAISKKTKAIIAVHLYGQCAPMERVMNIAEDHQLFVIEDTAQALGATYTFSNGVSKKAGTIGDIGCTSFFPSKNLGCYGDGGAICTNNEKLATKTRMIANHGQPKYIHQYIGVNSRLDSIQAAILRVKLKHLEHYNNLEKTALFYDKELNGIDGLQTPSTCHYSNHVYHQYTLKVDAQLRDALQDYLKSVDIHQLYTIPFQSIIKKLTNNLI